MAKHIDISSKITGEYPTVTFFGKTYTVKNGKNNMLLMQQYMGEEHNETDILNRGLEQLLGAQALQEIEAMDLPMDEFQAVYIAVMAAAAGEDYEDAAARFQKQK